MSSFWETASAAWRELNASRSRSSAPGLATGDFNGDGVQDLLASGLRLMNVLFGLRQRHLSRTDTRSGPSGCRVCSRGFQ
ncbi:MAG: FG-GAP repeat protein [Deltaproteobacteria bacterium]|nr:FG-GAP repeat protein [Deltaproteobacteria bacterium]